MNSIDRRYLIIIVENSSNVSFKKYIEGKFIIIQDADLEYDPNDYFSLLEYIQINKLKVLYGSRVLEHNNREKIQNFSHKFRVFANYVLTKINNIIVKQYLKW